MTTTSQQPEAAPPRVLITGATGYIGSLFTRALVDSAEAACVIATGRRAEVSGPLAALLDGATYASADVRDAARLTDLMREHNINTVVHLAALVTPRPGEGPEVQYAVDVEGTRHVVQACVDAGVKRLIYTSSGAAYGYTPQNARPLTEDAPLLGNDIFVYSRNKRIVEEDLERARAEHPQLEQLIFRVSTVMGASTENQITALFEPPVVVGLRGVDSPFCIIWDQDVVACLMRGVLHPELSGIYNLTADGVMSMREIAARNGRVFLPLPVGLLKLALTVLRRLGKTPYGPEQTLYLEWRPVLDITRLKRDFGFTPSKTTSEVVDLFLRS